MKLTIASLIVSFIVSVFLIPSIIKISHHKKWYDEVDERKIHDGDIPRIGGVGIFWGFIIPIQIICHVLLREHISDEVYIKFNVLTVAACVIHLIGLLDDFQNLRPRYKFIGQFVVAIILTIFGFHFPAIHIPFTSFEITAPAITIPISIVWIVGVSNAVNLIDGIDGLSSIITITAAAFIGVRNYLSGDMITVIVCACLIGATLGFFYYNKPKASIFMGDSGSIFIGFLLAIIPMLQIKMNHTLIFESSITILTIPIIDTVFAMSRRIYNGIHIATPDKEHFHHLLLDFKLSNVTILLIVVLINLYLGLISILAMAFPSQSKTICSVMFMGWILSFFAIYLLHRRWKLKIR